MVARVFVDTNILVYAMDAGAGEKQRQAAEWLRHLWAERAGRLSYQVLQEFYVTVTTKLDPGLDAAAARDEVRTLFAWEPLSVDARVMEGAWRHMDRASLSWWDALIVSAAEVAGCAYLLTEDLQTGQRLGDVTVVDPFVTSPADLG